MTGVDIREAQGRSGGFSAWRARRAVGVGACIQVGRAMVFFENAPSPPQRRRVGQLNFGFSGSWARAGTLGRCPPWYSGCGGYGYESCAPLVSTPVVQNGRGDPVLRRNSGFSLKLRQNV